MKTNELIEFLKNNTLTEFEQPKVNEIIQRLMEFDELKRVIHDTVDTAIELYSFLFSVTGEFE